MSRVRDLVKSLKESLALLDYRQCAKTRIGEMSFAAVLAAPKRPGKYFCVVVDLPERGDDRAAERLVSSVRRALTKEFMGLPWPGRLNTHIVLVGDRDVCRHFLGQRSSLIDRNGFHVNVVLGTVLVDIEVLGWHSVTSQGLMGTGHHFGQIEAAVEQWCRQRRQQGQWAWADRWPQGVT
ncbi:MAG: hypothetical protein ACYTF6_04910 [Planctomycetota bacterium]|jgi:hypothetical protein